MSAPLRMLVSTQFKPTTNGTAIASKIPIPLTKGLNFNIINLFNAIGTGNIRTHVIDIIQLPH